MVDQIDKFKKLCLWRGADFNAKQKSKAAWPIVVEKRRKEGLVPLTLELRMKPS
jgi:hypothetical protein